MDAKLLIALVSVGLGWLLAQGTALAKTWWAGRRLKVGLLTELGDIEDQLHRVVMIHARHLQVYALKGVEPTSSLPIRHMFFEWCFKDAFGHLNRAQRVSYQLIHASLDELNKNEEALAVLAAKCLKEHVNASDPSALAAMKAWGDRVIGIYKSARTIAWHIGYHRRHWKAPSFDIMGPMHESYVKFVQELDDEVKTIVEKAKNLKLEDFVKIYDERAFSPSNKAP